MKMCSGRWRVAMGLGAALAIIAGFTPAVRAIEPPRPLFPWRKQAAMKSIPQATSKGDYVVLPDALTLEEESPLTSMTQTEPSKPPASSTGTPTPPPPLNKPAPTPSISQPAPKTDGLTPVPNTTMGEVLGGPVIYGEQGVGDPYPLQYRDRPVGNREKKAEIISRNRSSEHEWYKEWRCRYYGYYPTQWKPFPEGWHLGRNIPAAPYVHPYDLKQPDPDPDKKRPPTPRTLRDQEKTRDENRAPLGRDAAPPLRNTPTDNSKTGPQKSGT